MRVTAGVAAIAIALTTSACEQPASTPDGAASNDLELGKIEATTRDVSDNTVTIELQWTFRQPGSPALSVAELPPVFLSNGQSDIRVVPDDGLPNWDNGQVRFEATVNVPKEAWRAGCWRADYRLVGVVASGPITCLNRGT